MPAVKDLNSSSDKWARRAGAASSDYAEGVRNPRRSWSDATKSAEGAWKEGVQQAASRGAFGKGVDDAGDSKWQEKSIKLGANRYGPGVQAAQGDWERGFAPYKQVIESTTLAPRGPKGSPQNYKRVQDIGEALHKRKVGGSR